MNTQIERRKTPRPMSRPEREIRHERRLYWIAIVCGISAGLFPAYVLAVMEFVK